MNPKNKMIVLLALVVIVQFVAIGYVLWSGREDRKLLDRVKESVDKTVNYDSIVSAFEKRMLDSVNVLRQELQNTKDRQHHENTKLRQQNKRLQDDFNRIDVSDRPDF